jgi:O-antigen/teichoic acid export membrane protein
MGRRIQILNNIRNLFYSFTFANLLQTTAVLLFIVTFSHFGEIGEYSNYRQFSYVIDFSTGIVLFGLNLILLKNDQEFLSTYFGSIVILILLFTISTLIILYFFNFIAKLSLLVYIILVFFNAINQIFFNMMVKYRLVKDAIVTSVVFFLISTFSLTLLYFTKQYSFLNVTFIRSACIFASFFIGFFSLFSKIRLYDLNYSYSSIMIVAKKAFPLGISILLGTLSLYVDKGVAKKLFVDLNFNIYSNGTFDIPFIGLIIANISVYFLPTLSEKFQSKDFTGFRILLEKLIRFGWYINGFIYTLILFNAHTIVVLLFSDKYEASVNIFLIYSVGLLFRILVYTHLIVSVEKEKKILIRMVGELALNILFSVILAHYYGLTGLVLGPLLVLAFYTVPLNFYWILTATEINFFKLVPIKHLILYLIRSIMVYFIANKVCTYLSINAIITFIISFTFLVFVNRKEISYCLKLIR